MWMYILKLVLSLVIVVLAGLTTEVSGQKANVDDPLPRVREGGTPYNPNQSLYPHAVELSALGPVNSSVASPPEYDPVKGVLYKYASGQWTNVVTAMVVALTSDPTHDEIAYVVVTSTSQSTTAANAFAAAGADLSKVEFLIQPSESIWIRDYGPHFVWRNNTLTIADSHYYPTRPLDNFMPTQVGDDNFGYDSADMGLYYSGGNFQPGPNRSGFVTSLVSLDNPSSAGFDENLIRELYGNFQGIDTLHILPQLPDSVDGTGHVDMWMYLVDEDTVIISEFQPGSNPTAISITNNAVPYMEALGFEVFRPPAWNVGSTHYTYANAFRVNDRIFVPAYGTALVPGGFSAYNDEDAAALAIWQAAAGPGVEIIPIQCIDIIPAAGAIHCVVMQVPRYTDSVPAANIISPVANDLMIAGNVETIRWSATDTNNAEVPTIDLYYSIDDGHNWNLIDTVGNTGAYEWTVPDEFSAKSLIRVVATSTDSDAAMATSERFMISPGTQTTYDFGTGAGVNKWVFGSSTTSWAAIDGNPVSVAAQISSLDYLRLATSNATGGDSDSNRYISPVPASSSESTHVFSFTIEEDVNTIDELVMRWEGYADRCTQAELYIWNVAQQQWGDGTGFMLAQNRYLDSWAGNEDGELVGIIRANFCDYVDANGVVRFLVYAERQADETFHDYASLTVKESVGSFTSLDIDQGVVQSGDVADLFDSDDVDLSVTRDVASIQAAIALNVEATANCAQPTSMSITVESGVFARPPVTQVIELWNLQTQQYEVIDSRPASRFSDQVTVATPTGDLSRFVVAGTGQINARIKYIASGNRAAFTANIDQIRWEIE